MPRTKTEQALAQAEEQHAGDPERAELLARARRFKSSWVELAEALAEARREHAWKRWGYASLEDYARKELHLRQETVDKLTGSFLFLQKRAPEVLVRDGVSAPIPTWQAVDFLRRAEEQESAPPDTVAELRRRVIDDVAPLAALSRKYKETLFPEGEDAQAARETAILRGAAQRLRELLEGTRLVPRRLADDVGEAVDQLLAKLGDGP